MTTAAAQSTAGADGAAHGPHIVERVASETPALGGVQPALLRRIYAGRGVTDAAELDYRLAGLPDFSTLKGIDAAVDELEAAIVARRPIRIVGDFDADGATSTTLAMDVLEAFGATVDFFMPHRATHGYGLSPTVVEAIGPPGAAGGLLLTVDNGIASMSGVDAARAAGWRVVVTDHHLPGERLPAAEAIVNPNQADCGFACKHLAGVGVVFYVMAALRARMAQRGVTALPRMGELLDLVAVGTVADVVPLDHVNRTLVSQGLRRIRAGRGRPGIVALAEIAGRDPQRLDTDDIGFAIGPRINAAGRLDDMSLGVACLRAGTVDIARQAAETLSSINRQRRSVQQRMQGQAEAALARVTALEEAPDALVVHEPDWHEGIVGLIASRLRERMHRPVVAFAPGEHGELKGSARSIPGLHIRDALAAVDAEAPGLITRFGGHAQAAGLSLPPSALADFAERFRAAVAARLTPDIATREYVTDGELDGPDHGLETAARLRDAGPWGAGFAAPLFHGAYHVLAQRIVGSGHLKLTVQAVNGGAPIEAMIFNRDELLDDSRVHRLVFRLQVNEFRGRQSANLIVEHCCVDAPGLVRRERSDVNES
ncbi:ssDNA exonuclease RecJ [Salinisphaera hydrothermalis C41B8]|uniref:Single-stranded-DNA-specific exonuclease RecJ n=1 Tax=Salinisphaera hydrothermalis (strain C41B8) TaxID=1304275 RepID=A0A084IJY6_SALHC|nr:single-stranded-DNA-specific exonuclease RecJ [Salinisphaera hydrothermalis]KEZ77020.1 ssDNA exonuclease RecJ [Salinisphaera hydrothermalis C41B8]